MKFNRTLTELGLPEWRVYFVDYKGLKRCIKALTKQASDASPAPGYDALRAQFDERLESELAKVARFYEMKIQWAHAQLSKHRRALTAVVRQSRPRHACCSATLRHAAVCRKTLRRLLRQRQCAPALPRLQLFGHSHFSPAGVEVIAVGVAVGGGAVATHTTKRVRRPGAFPMVCPCRVARSSLCCGVALLLGLAPGALTRRVWQRQTCWPQQQSRPPSPWPCLLGATRRPRLPSVPAAAAWPVCRHPHAHSQPLPSRPGRPRFAAARTRPRPCGCCNTQVHCLSAAVPLVAAAVAASVRGECLGGTGGRRTLHPQQRPRMQSTSPQPCLPPHSMHRSSHSLGTTAVVPR